jgi:hypothetical protein
LQIKINPCYAEALEPLISSLYWGYNGYYFHCSETEFDKIQSVIAEKGEPLLFALRVALTEWRTDFEKRRTDRNLPHYTPAYIREQVDKFNLRRELGIPVDHEGMEFALSLANLHALNWITELETTFSIDDQQPKKNQQTNVTNQEPQGVVIGILSEDVFWIIDAIREAGRSYINHAPKNEEQQPQSAPPPAAPSQNQQRTPENKETPDEFPVFAKASVQVEYALTKILPDIDIEILKLLYYNKPGNKRYYQGKRFNQVTYFQVDLYDIAISKYKRFIEPGTFCNECKRLKKKLIKPLIK